MMKASNDRKTRARTTQQNTYGLLPGLGEGTCPGCTSEEGGCAYIAKGRKLPVCYVNKLMTAYPSVKGILQHNTDLLKKATKDKMTQVLDEHFKTFYKKEIKYEKLKDGDKISAWYRLHWAGDLFSEDYADALVTAMLRNPNMMFWTYTRTFEHVHKFSKVPNLTLYISADAANIDEALACHEQNKASFCTSTTATLGFCYLSKVKPKSIDSFYLLDCPVDANKMALEQACHKCKLCLKGKPIWFKQK